METAPDEEREGRWDRSRRRAGGRSWLGAFVVVVVVPILIGAAVLLIAGRGVAFEAIRLLTAHKFPDVHWISGPELSRWMQDPGRAAPVVLDARSQPEYDVSHLRDAVRIDPSRPSLHRLSGVARTAPIVVYCAVGYRSARVAHWLMQQGYTDVQNLTGSIFEWANDGRPVFRAGRPALTVHPFDRRWGLLLESRYRAPVPDVQTPFVAP